MTKEEVKKLLLNRMAKYKDTIDTIEMISALDKHCKQVGDTSAKKFDLGDVCEFIIDELQYTIDHDLKDFDDRPDEVSKDEFVCKYVKNLLDAKAHDAYTSKAIKQFFQEAEDMYDRDMLLHKRDAYAKCDLSAYEKPAPAGSLVGKYIVPNTETNKTRLKLKDLYYIKTLYRVESFEVDNSFADDPGLYMLRVVKSRYADGAITATPMFIDAYYHVVELPDSIRFVDTDDVL